MPFGKFKGREVSQLSRRYLQWLHDNVELHGPLQAAVHAALGLPAPKQPPPETIEQIQDRAIREVMDRFAQRERRGEDDGEPANV